MKTVVHYPDIDWMNHRTRDFKYHYRYAMGYYDLVLDSFKADLQGEDKTPTFFEGEEYRKANSTVCGKQAVLSCCIIDNRFLYQS